MNFTYMPLTFNDREDFFKLVGDERVAKTMRFDCPKTIEESDLILKDYISENNHTYAFRFKEGEKLWGIFAFKGENNSSVANLSQMIEYDQWGKGLGNQIVKVMVELARKEKWYKALEGYVLETNIASRKMAEKVGFKEKERHRFPGMKEDLVVYRIEI